MECAACYHLWQGDLVLDCAVLTAGAVMRALRCPHCGSKEVLLLFGERAAAALQQINQEEPK
jgi:hypothetical protein